MSGVEIKKSEFPKGSSEKGRDNKNNKERTKTTETTRTTTKLEYHRLALCGLCGLCGLCSLCGLCGLSGIKNNTRAVGGVYYSVEIKKIGAPEKEAPKRIGLYYISLHFR